MQSDDDARRRNFGLVAEAMGLQSAIELLQARLDQITGQLDGSHKPAAEDLPVTVRKAVGRPRKQAGHPREAKQPKPGMLQSGWPADPEERKREMARRQAKWGKNIKRGPKPVADQLVNMRKAAKASWARLSPRKRKERLAKMLAGRRAKRKKLPMATLAVAS